MMDVITEANLKAAESFQRYADCMEERNRLPRWRWMRRSILFSDAMCYLRRHSYYRREAIKLRQQLKELEERICG